MCNNVANVCDSVINTVFVTPAQTFNPLYVRPLWPSIMLQSVLSCWLQCSWQLHHQSFRNTISLCEPFMMTFCQVFWYTPEIWKAGCLEHSGALMMTYYLAHTIVWSWWGKMISTWECWVDGQADSRQKTWQQQQWASWLPCVWQWAGLQQLICSLPCRHRTHDCWLQNNAMFIIHTYIKCLILQGEPTDVEPFHYPYLQTSIATLLGSFS